MDVPNTLANLMAVAVSPYATSNSRMCSASGHRNPDVGSNSICRVQIRNGNDAILWKLPQAYAVAQHLLLLFLEAQ